MPNKPHRLKRIKLDEVSLVDDGANQHAKVALWKRNAEPAPDEDVLAWVSKSFDQPRADFTRALADMLDMERGFQFERRMSPLISALQESMSETAKEMHGEDRDKRMRENVESFMSEVRSMLSDTEKAGMTGDDDGGPAMTPDELAKRLEEMESEVSTLKADKETVEGERDALAKALDDAGYDVEGTDVTKRAEPEYIEMDGEKVLKSAVPAPLLKRLEKLEGDAEAEALSKRANSELPNLAGDTTAKGALLKAVDGISDEATRESVVTALKAADAAVKQSFIEKGQTATGEADANDPSQKLDQLAKSYASENGVPYESAYAQVVSTPEGRELRAAAHK